MSVELIIVSVLIGAGILGFIGTYIAALGTSQLAHAQKLLREAEESSNKAEKALQNSDLGCAEKHYQEAKQLRIEAEETLNRLSKPLHLLIVERYKPNKVQKQGTITV